MRSLFRFLAPWVLAALACGPAVAETCQTQKLAGLVIASSQASAISLRLANGSTQTVEVTAALAAGLPPGAWIELQHGAACPPASEATVFGGTLAGEVVDRSEDGSLLLLRTAGTLAAPAPMWRLETVLERAADVPTAAKVQQVSLTVALERHELTKTLHPGDQVAVEYRCAKACPGGPAPDASMQQLTWRQVAIGPLTAGAVLLASAGGLMLLAAFIVRGPPWRLAVGQDNRYSTSKFQILVWFWVVLSAYLATSALRVGAGGLGFLGGVGIPEVLLALSGISTLTFAAAKAITVHKVERAAPTLPEPKPAATEAQMSDLVHDDARQLDLGDFQVTVLTVLAALFYLGLMVDFLATVELRRELSLPDMDTTWLGLLGLSHAGYLGKKAAGGVEGGMSAAQAVQKAQALLSTARADAALAAAALARAKATRDQTEAALKQVVKAAERAAAQGPVQQAEAEGAAALAAATEAAAAASNTAASAAALNNLRAAWARDGVASVPIASAHAEAARLAQEAQDRSALAQTKSAEARIDAASAVLNLQRKVA